MNVDGWGDVAPSFPDLAAWEMPAHQYFDFVKRPRGGTVCSAACSSVQNYKPRTAASALHGNRNAISLFVRHCGAALRIIAPRCIEPLPAAATIGATVADIRLLQTASCFLNRQNAAY